MYSSQLVSSRIKQIILEKGLTQKQVLEECEINENLILRMGEKKGMGSFYLARIADKLNCSTDFLLGRSDVVSVNRHSGLSKEEERLLFMFRSLTKNDRIRAFDRVQVLYDDEQAALKQEA